MAKQNNKNKPYTQPVVQASAPVTEHQQPVPPVSAAAHAKPKPMANTPFLFDRTNYMWMIAGVVLIIIGFALMSGGRSENAHEFHYDEIYSFRRVTLAPLTVLLGFAVEFYAIMRKPSHS